MATKEVGGVGAKPPQTIKLKKLKFTKYIYSGIYSFQNLVIFYFVVMLPVSMSCLHFLLYIKNLFFTTLTSFLLVIYSFNFFLSLYIN